MICRLTLKDIGPMCSVLGGHETEKFERWTWYQNFHLSKSDGYKSFLKVYQRIFWISCILNRQCLLKRYRVLYMEHPFETKIKLFLTIVKMDESKLQWPNLDISHNLWVLLHVLIYILFIEFVYYMNLDSTQANTSYKHNIFCVNVRFGHRNDE